jgi:hypothetical protein
MSTKSAASIRARLKNRADEMRQDFNLALTQFGLERLLYRLSISKHAGAFLLKGALLFWVWYGESTRPTRDADLLGFGLHDLASAVASFREICSIEVDDGLLFDLASVKAAEIRKEAGYGVGRARNAMHIAASSTSAAAFSKCWKPRSVTMLGNSTTRKHAGHTSRCATKRFHTVRSNATQNAR